MARHDAGDVDLPAGMVAETRQENGTAHSAAAVDVIHTEGCAGFLVSADGSRFRLRMLAPGGGDCVLELPVAGLASLMKVIPEVQQTALPRGRGDNRLRVVRKAVTWSLERDMADDALTLVLLTAEGFEWCFTLADSDVFRMAECLREERTVTLPTPPGHQ